MVQKLLMKPVWMLLSAFRMVSVLLVYLNICVSLLVYIYLTKVVQWASMKFFNFDFKALIKYKQFT